MKMTTRTTIAIASWGMTVVMMHPSLSSLLVAGINAGLLATLTHFPRKN